MIAALFPALGYLAANTLLHSERGELALVVAKETVNVSRGFSLQANLEGRYCFAPRTSANRIADMHSKVRAHMLGPTLGEGRFGIRPINLKGYQSSDLCARQDRLPSIHFISGQRVLFLRPVFFVISGWDRGGSSTHPNVLCWRAPEILQSGAAKEFRLGRIIVSGVRLHANLYPWPEISIGNGLRVFQPVLSGIGGALGFDRTFFRVQRGPFGPLGSSPSNSEGKSADYRTDNPHPPSGLARALSCIGGLPLGAKVAGTLVVAGGAWFIMLAGFLRLLEGRREVVKGASYLLIGAALWIASSAFWWAGS